MEALLKMKAIMAAKKKGVPAVQVDPDGDKDMSQEKGESAATQKKEKKGFQFPPKKAKKGC